MEINRAWAMPNKNTFSIKPIRELVKKYVDATDTQSLIVDPFVGNSPFSKDCLSNDLDPSVDSEFHLDATEFLSIVEIDFEGAVDLVLYDPPYSPRQVSEVYKKFDRTVNMQTTQSSYWGNQKKIISRIVNVGGHVITCGWNSGGIGKTKGFEIIEILLVAHGGWHNDTIVTVEKKIR